MRHLLCLGLLLLLLLLLLSCICQPLLIGVPVTHRHWTLLGAYTLQCHVAAVDAQILCTVQCKAVKQSSEAMH